MNDDKLMQAATQLATDVDPERDLWPGISEAIERPAPKRWTPMLAQAAAVVLLVGTSSAVTYMTTKGSAPKTVVASPDMIFEQASFGNRYNLGPGFQTARNALSAELDAELQKVSADDRANIDANLKFIEQAIFEINAALEKDPENILLQDRLLNTYREELTLLRRVGGLTRNVMMRNDI
jgi:hypothetical protein